MRDPKAYIFEMDNLKVLVCAYSSDLFNMVLKTFQSESESFTTEVEFVSHKKYSGSSCNCKETVAEFSYKMAGTLKTFDRAIIPIEILKLERGCSNLLIFELYKTHKKTGNKVTVVNTAIRNKSHTDMENRSKYCLLRLHTILNRDLSIFLCAPSRSHSFSNKNTVYKDCIREVAREIAEKGASPSDIAQTCLRTRDTNRCWFDYRRIMDICIQHKIDPSFIAELIKDIAVIDPMHPDPAACIKERRGIGDNNSRATVKEGRESHLLDDGLNSSQSSSEKSTSDSSSIDDLRNYKTRSYNSFERQTSRCTQTDFGRCQCVPANNCDERLLYANEDYLEMDFNSRKKNFAKLPPAGSNVDSGYFLDKTYEDLLTQIEAEDDSILNNIDISQLVSIRKGNSKNFKPQLRKLENGSNNGDKFRSASQPILRNIERDKFTTFHENNLSKTAVDSSTQTLDNSITDNVSPHLQKCASEGNICNRQYLNNNASNSSREAAHMKSEVGVNTFMSINASRIFKIKASRTECKSEERQGGNHVYQLKHISLIPTYKYTDEREENNDGGCHQLNANNSQLTELIPSNHGSSPYEEGYPNYEPIYVDVPFQLNRNGNNHSTPGSTSSRNSQIVEVDNANMGKMSSVIVDQDSRPIIYFSDNVQDNMDTFQIEQCPFYERSEMIFDRENSNQNTNFNNSIRSVTVSNRDTSATTANKCSVAGCQNSVAGFSHSCENQPLPRSECCSPERCLSRLSCLVTLNRQFLERKMSPEQSMSHRNALRRVIYGPYDEVNCDGTSVDRLSNVFEPAKLHGDFLQDDSQHLISISDPNRRFSRHTGSMLHNDGYQILSANDHPLHSSMRMSNGHGVESYPLDMNSPSQRHLSDVNQIHNPAQVVYEPEPREFITPMQSRPISDCRNASITRCYAHSHVASCLNVPLSSIGMSSNTPSNNRVVEIGPQYIASDYTPHSNGQYLLVDSNDRSYVKRSQKSSDRIKNSCDLSFPLSLQLCPITGCRNITTTGQPPCMQLQSPGRYQGSTVNDPCHNCDLRKESRQCCKLPPPPIRSSTINHGKVQNSDILENNEVVYNDSMGTPTNHLSVYEEIPPSRFENKDVAGSQKSIIVSTPRGSSTRSGKNSNRPERSIKISHKSVSTKDYNTPRASDQRLLEDNMTRPGSNMDYLPRVTESSERSNLENSNDHFKKSGSFIRISNNGTTVNTLTDGNPQKDISVKSQVVYVYPANSEINEITSNPLSDNREGSMPVNEGAMELRDSMAHSKATSIKVEISNSTMNKEESAVLRESNIFPKLTSDTQANNPSLVTSEKRHSQSSKVGSTDDNQPPHAVTTLNEPFIQSGSELMRNNHYLQSQTQQPIRTVSSSSKHTTSSTNQCSPNNDVYATVVDLPRSVRDSAKNPNNITEDKHCLNNSSSLNLDLDYLYLDCLTTTVRSRIFCDTILFEDPECLLLGKYNNMFFSTPERVLNIHVNQILVSERWDMHSDIVLEHIDNMTVNLPAFVDHSNNKMFLLVPLSVYFLFCRQLPILVHSVLLPSKSTTGKVGRFLQSFRTEKATDEKNLEKNDLIKDFRHKLVKIIRKCGSPKQEIKTKSNKISTFSLNCAEVTKRIRCKKLNPDGDEGAVSQSTVDQSQQSLCTQSCVNAKRNLTYEFSEYRHWNSEPNLPVFNFYISHDSRTVRRPIHSPAKISTSDLSLLCVEVLRKMDNKCIIGTRTKNELAPRRLCRSTTFTEGVQPNQSSKDTLMLIIKALRFLHRSQLDNSGPSNKTLDSVSSIKTCSGDRLESIASLQRKIVRPSCDDNIIISAYNKTL